MKNSEGRKMARLILIAILVMIAYFTVKSFFRPVRKPRPKPDFPRPEKEDAAEMVQDPECGTYIPLESAEKTVIKGQTYYFCSQKCREAFQRKLEGKQ
jgi:uncharacterized protein